jgi:hypothetical protein
MSTCEFAITIPPTPGEWAAMADNHLRALRLAYVIANDSASALVGRRSKRTADMAIKLGQAARFHRAFAELCEIAEKRLIDASLQCPALKPDQREYDVPAFRSPVARSYR